MYFFSKNKFKLIIAGITVALIMLMAISSATSGRITFVSEAVSIIITPVQKLVNNITGGVGGFFATIGSNKNYIRENDELKKQIASLENTIRENDALISENNRLRSLLDLKEKQNDYEYIAADVVGVDITNWSKTFTIDKGLIDGITKNCAVVNEKGLVGYVYEVGRTWAKVSTIVDSDVSVGAKITRLNLNAVVSGDLALSSDSKCIMNYITKNTNIEVGDYCVTSGSGGIYPEGLYIGKIVELTDDVSGLSQAAIIEPGVDFEDLSEILVIKK